MALVKWIGIPTFRMPCQMCIMIWNEGMVLEAFRMGDEIQRDFEQGNMGEEGEVEAEGGEDMQNEQGHEHDASIMYIYWRRC